MEEAFNALVSLEHDLHAKGEMSSYRQGWINLLFSAINSFRDKGAAKEVLVTLPPISPGLKITIENMSNQVIKIV